MAAPADLLTVDTEAVKRFAPPAESQLENFVQLFQRQIVGHGYQPGHEWADFQQNDTESETSERDRLRHAPKLNGLPRLFSGLVSTLGWHSLPSFSSEGPRDAKRSFHCEFGGSLVPQQTLPAVF